MKLLGSSKGKIIKNDNGDNVPNLEIIVHYKIFNNHYEQNLRVLYASTPNKSFGQLLHISP